MKCFKEHGDVWPPSHSLARRPRRQMTDEDDRVLIRMLVSSPESMLKEQFREFCGRTGCLMHVSTFCRAVKRLGYTRKKLEAYAQRRDQQASDRFLTFVLGTLSVDQLFFLDETAKDRRDLRRGWGYALRGLPAVANEGYSGRGRRTSTLATFDIDGFVSWSIINGTFDEDAFMETVRTTVVPFMTPFPGKRSVLVLDNASIHHSVRFAAMMAAHGCMVLYTPAYCFNLTPLDNGAFGLLKQYIQHEQPPGDMFDIMEAALQNAVKPRAARKCFRQCGYGPLMP